MSLKESKVDPRVQRTKEFLQQAFADLMREKDFEEITVQDIADRARVNRATFYDHFTDKYDLLKYAAQGAFQRKLDERLPPSPRFTYANLRLMTVALCELLNAYLGHCPVPTQNTYKPLLMIQLQAYVSETLLDWMGKSQLDQGDLQITPEAIASLTSWVVFGIAAQGSITQRGRKYTSTEQMVDQTLPLLIRGLKPFLSEA